MQTFLPALTYADAAQLLDNKRLGKQRVEAKQILLCLLDEGCQGWKNHPAVKMWKGYEYGLALYGWTICNEWRVRGYKDTLLEWFDEKIVNIQNKERLYPDWFDENFVFSHQSNLIRKNPEFYLSKFPDVPNDLPYIWPVK